MLYSFDNNGFRDDRFGACRAATKSGLARRCPSAHIRRSANLVVPAAQDVQTDAERRRGPVLSLQLLLGWQAGWRQRWSTLRVNLRWRLMNWRAASIVGALALLAVTGYGPQPAEANGQRLLHCSRLT